MLKRHGARQLVCGNLSEETSLTWHTVRTIIDRTKDILNAKQSLSAKAFYRCDTKRKDMPTQDGRDLLKKGGEPPRHSIADEHPVDPT